MWGLAITTSLASPFVRSSKASSYHLRPRRQFLEPPFANLTTLTPPDALAARGHMTRGLKLQDHSGG